MEKIKVSVIIPVYNVENYIEECVESVINQTLKEIEIIIVNDGTKDNSIKKIEKYLSDSRVILINKENGGVSSARNAGLKIARGEYISFIDSDDFIEPIMLEKLYSNSKLAEIIFSNIAIYNNETKNKKYDKIEAIFGNENKGSYLFYYYMFPTINRIYRKDYLEKIKLTFTEGIIYEDIIFSIKASFLAKKVKYIDEFYYDYRINRTGSIMTTTNSERKKGEETSFNLLIIKSLEIIIKELEEFEKQYKNNWSSFEKISLKILEINLKIWLSIEKQKKYLDKEETKKFQNFLKIEWKSLSELEKKVLKKEINEILKRRTVKDIDVFDLFWWKNRIFTKKSFRRVVELKIKNLL